MQTKLYIGSEQANFDESFNVMFSIGDIRDLSTGSNNKTYTLNLPLTGTNKRLLKFISQSDVKSEPSAIGRLYIGEQLIISGTILILGYSDLCIKIIITKNDWIDDRSKIKMTDLDLSAYDHALTHANVDASWTASYLFYRYPMINFGALASGETGASVKWLPNDFIPMFSVSQLMTEMLKPYTISSAWLATTYVKDLYILARETPINQDFILNKELSAKVTNDSDITVSGSSSTTMMVTLTDSSIMLSTIIIDNGGIWSSDHYTIPEDGTYRFKVQVTLRNTAFGNTNLTITDEQVITSLMMGVTTLDTITTAAYSGGELLDAITYTLDSGYYYCTAGQVVTIDLMARCRVNIISGTQTVAINVTTDTNIALIWNKASLYHGIGENISAEEMMPDMTQADFLAAIKEIFNLRFWMDKSRQIIYIEPWDQFLSSTVIDLTEYIDSEGFQTEIISPNYNKNITFKWKDDTSDYAYNKFLKTAISPGQNNIILNSAFTKAEPLTKEHPFSSIITDYNIVTSNFLNTPEILKEEILIGATEFDRMVNFNTRIVHWDGMTAGFTWNFESDIKTTYPKISGIDWVDIYDDYQQKIFHYIDKGKLLIVKMKLKPLMLTQFYTVINTATEEGFRPIYQINDDYYFLQKITTDGVSAELELILKV